MMDMSTMSGGMMMGFGLFSLVIIIIAILGIAALIKYLRS